VRIGAKHSGRQGVEMIPRRGRRAQPPELGRCYRRVRLQRAGRWRAERLRPFTSISQDSGGLFFGNRGKGSGLL
jgi:hypothetical protein